MAVQNVICDTVISHQFLSQRHILTDFLFQHLGIDLCSCKSWFYLLVGYYGKDGTGDHSREIVGRLPKKCNFVTQRNRNLSAL